MDLNETMPFDVSGADETGLAAKMSADGYLYLPRLLDPDCVAQAREAIAAVLDSFGLLAADTAPADLAYVGGDPPERDVLVAAHRQINHLPAFARLAAQRSVARVMESLLGEDIVTHTRKICRVKYPHDPYDVVGPHQDFWYVKGAEETFTCWAPLTHVDADTGGLAVLPGSHKRGALAHARPETSRFHGVAGAADSDGWVWSPMRSGDVLIFHSLTVHAGLPNTSTRIRLSVDCRYQHAATPMDTSHNRPHME